MLTEHQNTAIPLRVSNQSVLHVHLWLDSVGISNKLGCLLVVVLLTIRVIYFGIGRLTPGCMLRDAENEDAADCLTEVGDVVQSDL